MTKHELSFPDEFPCLNCGHVIPLQAVCSECGTQNVRCNALELFDEILEKRAIDARYGGYILGRDSTDDDIPMVSHVGDGIYQFGGLMQGGEYLLNVHAVVQHKDRIESINDEKGVPTDFSPPITGFSSIINANFIPNNGFLLVDTGQFIVNRYATQKYYKELEKLNALSLEFHQFPNV